MESGVWGAPESEGGFMLRTGIFVLLVCFASNTAAAQTVATGTKATKVTWEAEVAPEWATTSPLSYRCRSTKCPA